MKTQSVLNKMEKFSTHKVEFAIMDDIRLKVDALVKEGSAHFDYVLKAEDGYKAAVKEYQALQGKIDNALAQAKELGAKGAIDSLERYSGIVKENIQFCSKAISKLESIG